MHYIILIHCWQLGSPEANTEMKFVVQDIYKGHHLWKEWGESRIGQREKLSCDADPTKPWLAGRSSEASVICPNVPSLGAGTISVYPCLTQSLDPVHLEQCESGKASLCSWGRCWKSWHLEAVCQLHSTQLGSKSCLEGRSGLCISMPATSSHTHTQLGV